MYSPFLSNTFPTGCFDLYYNLTLLRKHRCLEEKKNSIFRRTIYLNLFKNKTAILDKIE